MDESARRVAKVADNLMLVPVGVVVLWGGIYGLVALCRLLRAYNEEICEVLRVAYLCALALVSLAFLWGLWQSRNEVKTILDKALKKS